MREPGRGAVVGRSVARSLIVAPAKFGVIRAALSRRRCATRSRVPRRPATRCLRPRPVPPARPGARADRRSRRRPPVCTSTIWSVRVSVTSSPVPQSCTTLPSGSSTTPRTPPPGRPPCRPSTVTPTPSGIHRRQRRQSVVVQLAQPRAHAAAAAMFAGAAGIGDEGFLQHQHRRARFHQFDRGVGGRGRIQQRGLAVAVLRCALAARP